MRRIALLALWPLSLVSLGDSAGVAGEPADPRIAGMLESVSSTTLLERVDALVAFGTRRSDQPGGLAAQAYIEERFGDLGLDEVRVQDYGSGADNVIGVLRGWRSPERLHVLGAHYDSVGNQGPTGPAPGADDNASGTAALLEAARAMAESGLRPAETVVFAAFAAEEFGLVGSRAFVDALREEGADVVEMVCLDVIGYVAPGTVPDLSVSSSSFTPEIEALIARIGDVAATYLPEWPFEGGRGCG